jgi:hypothetical protein
VPIVGLIVMQGFFAEVHQRLVLQRPEPYVRFDFSDLVAYLKRGLAPFVMTLLVAFAFAFYLALWFVGVLVAVGIGGPASTGTDNIALMVVLIAGGLLTLPVIVLFFALQNAALTRAELTGDVGKSLNLGALWAYAGKTWKRVLGMSLLTAFIGLGLLLVGLLACVIGMFVTLSMMMILQLHVRWQIYNEYLLEGGEPIELGFSEPLTSEVPKGPPPGFR